VRSSARSIGVVIIVAIVAAGAFGIWRVVQRSKQIQSYALLQSMRDAAERVPVRERNTESLNRAISGVYGGRDAWGNPVAVYTQTQPTSYVLVSFGSDGRPDTTSTAEYFTMPEADIQRQTARDIVFRDGKVITFGGK
jgi:hypothetical protein